jgi:hypothetical protein
MPLISAEVQRLLRRRERARFLRVAVLWVLGVSILSAASIAANVAAIRWVTKPAPCVCR